MDTQKPGTAQSCSNAIIIRCSSRKAVVASKSLPPHSLSPLLFWCGYLRAYTKILNVSC
jgi:hypothetical protein